jgi:hypothetical protein
MSSSSCRRPADAPLSRRCGLERSFDPMGRPTIWPSADPGSSSASPFKSELTYTAAASGYRSRSPTSESASQR